MQLEEYVVCQCTKDCPYSAICELAQIDGTHRPWLCSQVDAATRCASVSCATCNTGKWDKVLVPELEAV